MILPGFITSGAFFELLWTNSLIQGVLTAVSKVTIRSTVILVSRLLIRKSVLVISLTLLQLAFSKSGFDAL